MLTIETVDPASRQQVNRFVALPYRLYAGHPCWTPPPLDDARRQLDRRRHPFYDHSEAVFFLATREERVVGRIAALEHRPFNTFHGARRVRFCLFECEDDLEAAEALFERAAAWGAARGLDTIVGPQGFSTFDGYGLLVDGFDHRQTMTMASYNFPYYARLIEALGFAKEVDFDSWRLNAADFKLPERVLHIAERARQRGRLKVYRFKNVRDIRRWVPRIGDAYNTAFRHNWEYAPLSKREITSLVDTLTLVGDPRWIAVITHDDIVVGFLLAFPDLSAALQRARGRLWPWTVLDILLERRRTKIVTLNGMGILPEFRGKGGNALLYAELDRVLRQQFEYGEITQVAETAVQMRRDLADVGAIPWKRHRVYTRPTRLDASPAAGSEG